jgi:hypothetical protein
MLASVRGTPYRRIERLFYDYIKTQRTEVESMLAKVSALERATGADDQIKSIVK